MPKEKKKIELHGKELVRGVPFGFHIEIDKIAGGLSICLNGVSSVIDFCEQYAVLKLGRAKVKVIGLDLSIAVYENKVAEISGKIGAVEFI